MSQVAQRALGWIADGKAHHQNQMLELARAVMRKNMGLPPENPAYPGSCVTINHNYGVTTTTTPTANQTPAPAPQQQFRYEEVTEVQQPDGTWKEVNRIPLT